MKALAVLKTTVSRLLICCAVAAVPPMGMAGEGPGWVFTEQSATVGLDYVHFFDTKIWTEEWHLIAGGLAIGDINGDGWDDIFAVTGYPAFGEGITENPNRLFISNQDGSYTEAATPWGLDPDDRHSAGPLIADFNGDGFNDLLIGGVRGNEPESAGRIRVYLHNGVSGFNDATSASGLLSYLDEVRNFVMSAGDIDKDGDLDLYVGHWNDLNDPRLFSNDGSAVFTDITDTNLTGDDPEYSFTPTFADVNDDGWPDLLLSSDFLNFSDFGGGSRHFINDGTGTFLQQDPSVLTDENGMGGAVADYDNDGDLDWFTSSIWDPDGKAEANWGVTGNRLYANDGNGNWTDVTDDAGVRFGYWGWGACFADFNNDMHLDLYHVNGFPSARWGEDEFETDPARMFINEGDGTFTEMSGALAVDDTGQGRAILCFDNDRDGDLDILVNNNNGPSRFFQNELDNENHWIQVKLVQPLPNDEAIGAVIRLTAGGITQMRVVYAGGNFASSHPTAQHFGLAGNTSVSSIHVTWPDGTVNILTGVAADQYLVVEKSDTLVKIGFE